MRKFKTNIMKKITLLFALLLSFVMVGQQNLATNGSFEDWTSGVPDGWPVIDLSTTDLTENTEAAFVSEGSTSASINLLTQDQGNTDIRQSVDLVGGTTYTVSLDVYATNNQARARIFYSGDFQNSSQFSDPSILNDWQTITFEYTPVDDGTQEFGIRFYDISSDWVDGSLFYIDNFRIEALSGATLAILTPNEGQDIATNDVDVEYSVQNFTLGDGTGDGYLSYTVDGGTPIAAYDSTPISLVGLAEGSHTVSMELLDQSDQSLSPAVTAEVNFNIVSTNNVEDIASLRASAQDGSLYTLTSEAILTYQQDFRGQKYIEDATGAILIDDNAGSITTTYSIGDGITNITGSVSEYNGVMQFIPSEDPGLATSNNNEIVPQIITLSEFMANFNDYESEVIAFENVSITEGDGTEVFAVGTDYTLTDDEANSTILRTQFYDADYIGEPIPSTQLNNVTGIASEFSGAGQLFPRSLEDFNATLGNTSFDMAKFSIYPNPTRGVYVNINTPSSDDFNVEVYDILGKAVISQDMNSDESLNISALDAGVYLVKITQDSNSMTKKLIVR